MVQKRSTRNERDRKRRRTYALLGVAALVTIGVLVGLAWAAYSSAESTPAIGDVVLETTLSASPTSTGEASATASTAPTVEVPAITGETLAEARLVLTALGLTIDVVEDAERETDDAGDARRVIGQSPSVGKLVDAGTTVAITVPRSARAAAPESDGAGYVVVLDPGHQSRSDSKMEPIGPGSSKTKPRVTGGTQGVVTGVPEYEIVLQIANNLKEELEGRGVTVVMTRTENDVNLSNSERAQIANANAADLFIRIHADGSADSQVSGISTLYPAQNQWTGPIAADSKRAALTVQDGMVAATGATSKGIVARDDISGFNWSEVPAVLVETGFMSNPVEDRLLSSAHYQDKLARGIADGTMSYLEGE
jgi:N-acetylmuramoyl-L-alanine amidase